MKVEPYEHKGFRIREKQLNTIANVLEIQQWYLIETDVWLKKLIAKKLLELEDIDTLKIDKTDLLKLMQCQIDL